LKEYGGIGAVISIALWLARKLAISRSEASVDLQKAAEKEKWQRERELRWLGRAVTIVMTMCMWMTLAIATIFRSPETGALYKGEKG
jgi:hypothetical protein